jgi:hypothetical protein
MNLGPLTLSLHWDWRRFLAPVCWFKGHVWDQYAVIHPAWNSPGRYCKRCRLSDVWHYKHELQGDTMVPYLVDSKGRRVS